MTNAPASGLSFMKMHGLGNDFVVLDGREGLRCDADLARTMGDRHRGVGFDQLALIEALGDGLRLTFWNSDGTTAGACGNATRCIAAWEMARRGTDSLDLTTERGVLHATQRNGAVTVNMGAPILDWAAIPLARDVDTLHLPIAGDPVATGMGNPHCTFFVNDAETIDLADYAGFEYDSLFPERTNVQVASVMARDRLRMRVWERGVGPTLASGSSSCATAVAAVRRGLTDRKVEIVLDGGSLHIDWRDDGVWMSGPTAHVFDGVWHG